MPLILEEKIILEYRTGALHSTIFAINLQIVVTQKGTNAKIAFQKTNVFVSGAKKGLYALANRNIDLQPLLL